MAKLAAIQVSASSDLERCIKKAAQYVQAAADRGAKIACFPELFSHPWFPNNAESQPFESAQPVSGPLISEMAALARRHAVAIVCPFFERASDGLFYNAAAVIDCEGELSGTYRKIHVPDIPNWREKEYFAPGDMGFPVFEVCGMRMGVQIGWDNFFPEGFRSLALAGAQVVFLPTAAAFASQERWLAMAVSHAVANGLFVVRVNRVGSESGLDFYGNSFAVRPDGELCAEPIGMSEGLLVVECEGSEVERARITWPFLKDRRPRQYSRVAGIDWGPGILPQDEKGVPSGEGFTAAAADGP